MVNINEIKYARIILKREKENKEEAFEGINLN